MNAHVELRDGVIVCGSQKEFPGCFCLRPENHWGPHVVSTSPGTYTLVQTACYFFAFEIAPIVAQTAINSKEWTWSE